MLKSIVAIFSNMLGRAAVFGSVGDRPSLTSLTTASGHGMGHATIREDLARPTARDLPTIVPSTMVGTMVGIDMKPTTADRVPPLAVVGTLAAHPQRWACRRPLVPANAAAAFLNWLRTHGLDDRPWPVDDVWFLASEDFAPAADLALPPRNLFLGALQRLTGVKVQYDKRIWIGSRRVKTTVYTFVPAFEMDLAA